MLIIKAVKTTTKIDSPQSDEICEQKHQTVSTVLKTFLHAHPLQTHFIDAYLVGDGLATVMHALC